MQQNLLPIVGHTVWWGLKGVRVQRVDLLAQLTTHGLANYAPDPPSSLVALRRALVAWLQSGGFTRQPTLPDDDEDEQAAPAQRTVRDLIRPMNKRRSTYAVFALVGEQVNWDAFGLHHATSARILLEKLTPQERLTREPRIICTTESEGIIEAEQEAQDLARALRPLWDEYKNLYISGDLSRMIRDIVDDMPGAVCVRREGGVYFIPQQATPQLDQLQQFIQDLPTDGGLHAPYLMRLVVPDERAAKRELARAVHLGFVAEITAMDKKLDDLRSKAKEVGSETIAARLVEYRTVRERVQMYADLIGMQQETITHALTQLNTKARRLILDADVDLADAPVVLIDADGRERSLMAGDDDQECDEEARNQEKKK